MMAVLTNLTARSGIEGPQIVLTWPEFTLANTVYTVWTGDATIVTLQVSSNIAPPALLDEDWTIIFTSATTYNLVGSVSGLFSGLSLDSLESPALCPIEIKIDAGYVAMAIGDTATFRTSTIRILRKQFTYSETATDGEIIYEDIAPSKVAHVDITAANMFSALSPTANIGYYYVVYTKTGTSPDVWETDVKAKTTCFTWDSSQWYGFFFNKLPDVFQQKDRDDTNQVILTLASDPDRDGEYSNLNEDGLTERGELQRYLRIYEVLFSRVMGGIDFYPNMFDVDDATPQFLALLGDLVGIDFNSDLSVASARTEIRTAVPFYRKKGTIESLEIVGRSVTGAIKVEADEVIKHMLVSNNPTRLSAQLNDPEIMAVFEHAGDPTGFSWGGYDSVTDTPADIYSFEVLRIFVYLTEGMSFTETVFNKLCRRLADGAPASTSQNVIVVDYLELETAGIYDEWNDVIT